jgi:hypothetical protein
MASNLTYFTIANISIVDGKDRVINFSSMLLVRVICRILCKIIPRTIDMYYKTYYGRNLRIFVISYGVRTSKAFSGLG